MNPKSYASINMNDDIFRLLLKKFPEYPIKPEYYLECISKIETILSEVSTTITVKSVLGEIINLVVLDNDRLLSTTDYREDGYGDYTGDFTGIE